jgi:hypothetical protein
MLKNDAPFNGLENAPRQRRRQRRAHHHLRCLRRLGISVHILGPTEYVPPTG